jgi:hypothetical protein
MQTVFDPVAPHWGRMAPARVEGTPTLSADVLNVPTSLGVLRITLHEYGMRLRSQKEVRDYQPS